MPEQDRNAQDRSPSDSAKTKATNDEHMSSIASWMKAIASSGFGGK